MKYAFEYQSPLLQNAWGKIRTESLPRLLPSHLLHGVFLLLLGNKRSLIFTPQGRLLKDLLEEAVC
ncbi:mCG147284 [Mus musculus]|jgi:hypothetical protein|nr:mCG147284 [Mus musculus]